MRAFPHRPVRRAVAFVLLGLAAGCGPSEDIRTYTVPKVAEPKPNPGAEPDAAAGEYRILGAMFPADDPTWFFKLTGKAAALSEHQAAFDQFLESVRFPNGPKKPPAYDPPAGWRSGGKESIHADTLLFGPAEKPLKLTVTPAMGGVQGNIQRWANQVGAPTGADDLAKYSRPVETKSGAKGVRVDVSGPKNPTSGGPMMMGGK